MSLLGSTKGLATRPQQSQKNAEDLLLMALDDFYNAMERYCNSQMALHNSLVSDRTITLTSTTTRTASTAVQEALTEYQQATQCVQASFQCLQDLTLRYDLNRLVQKTLQDHQSCTERVIRTVGQVLHANGLVVVNKDWSEHHTTMTLALSTLRASTRKVKQVLQDTKRI